MANQSERRWSHADYTVACICPMGVELAPVEAVLDETHDPLPTIRDQNTYTLGKIAGHNIVVAVMPEIGNNSAATVATQLMNDFPCIRFSLLVGIGGGIPNKVDVRLGDVVVGHSTGTSEAVIQYDYGKRLAEGRFERTGHLAKPPPILTASIQKLQAQHARIGSRLPTIISDMIQRYPIMKEQYSLPAAAPDQLFLSSYIHQGGTTCDGCDREHTKSRVIRPSQDPHIHYGVVGSANVVIKDAVVRDKLDEDFNILCVEMEAAGLSSSFPCLVIRGICDYADSHKNKLWQPYAAAVAAAYMKELLSVVPVKEPVQTPKVEESISSPFNLGTHLGNAPVIERDLFIGRVSELQEMREILRPGETSTEQLRLVLGGVGGMGKTQLAIAYARDESESYTSIFWLDAASEAEVRKSLKLLVECVVEIKTLEGLREEYVTAWSQTWLSDPRNKRWLLIFDNYDDPDDFDLQEYYPYSSHGTIIVTTRLPEQVNGHRLQLRPLEHIDQSLQVLETRSKRVGITTDRHAQSLAERLAGFPLALATAGAFLKKSTWTFEKYLTEYQQRWNISPQRPVKLQEYGERTLYTTWDLSYDRLLKYDSDAACLLKLLAYFGNQQITSDLICNPEYDDPPKWLADAVANPADFESMMAVLIDYCFVELQTSTQSYGVHACVHDWTLAHLNQDLDLQNYCYALSCVGRALPSGSEQNQPKHAWLIPHALRLSHTNFMHAELLSNLHKPLLRTASDVARLLIWHREYDAAVVMCGQLYQIFESRFGQDEMQTLIAADNLSIIFTAQGQWAEAEVFYKIQISRVTRFLGPEASFVLLLCSRLMDVCLLQGKLHEAGELADRVLRGAERLVLPSHSHDLDVLWFSANIRYIRNQHAEAERMYNLALAGSRDLGQPLNARDAVAQHRLAKIYSGRRDFDEAERAYLRAIEDRQQIFGPNHADTLETVAEICAMYREQGKIESIADICQRFPAYQVPQ